MVKTKKKEGFDFEENLLKASVEKIDIYKAMDEWVVDAPLVKSCKEEQCVCNRMINNYAIVRNKNNNKLVTVGSTCVKNITKINLETKNGYKSSVINSFKKGIYVEITDINEYCEKILIEHFKELSIDIMMANIDKYRGNMYFRDIFHPIFFEKLQDSDLSSDELNDIHKRYKNMKHWGTRLNKMYKEKMKKEKVAQEKWLKLKHDIITVNKEQIVATYFRKQQLIERKKQQQLIESYPQLTHEEKLQKKKERDERIRKEEDRLIEQHKQERDEKYKHDQILIKKMWAQLGK